MSADGRTIYVIESGEYSDYGVHHAYTTREAAEAAVATYNFPQDGGPHHHLLFDHLHL